MEEPTLSNPVAFIRENSEVISDALGRYGYIVIDSLYFIVLGMLAVFLLHKLASKFLFAYLPNARLLRVIFGALYVLVLVVTVLIAVRRLGFDPGAWGQLLVLLVLVGAVLVYFLIPFLPKLPFLPGHVIETGGAMGVVDSISSFHTTLRKFDGTMVFLPNALVVASRIQNFSYTPTRRIEIKLALALDSDPGAAIERVIAVARAHARVLEDPAPAAYLLGADANGIALALYCWVENADFLPVQSDLWQRLLDQAGEPEGLHLAMPRTEVLLPGAGPASAKGVAAGE